MFMYFSVSFSFPFLKVVFGKYFRLTENLRGRDSFQVFLAQTHGQPFPSSRCRATRGTFARADVPALFRCHLSSQLTVEFAFAVVHSLGLDTCMMSLIHLCRLIPVFTLP